MITIDTLIHGSYICKLHL